MKRVLITGINGMLGKQVAQALAGAYEVTGIGRSATGNGTRYHAVDLENEEQVQTLKGLSFDYVVHAAANVNLQDCENHPEKARQIHVRASGQLAALFPEATFLYISTDSVFDGVHGHYTEKDEPHPLNAYSRTKYEGEEAVMANNPKHYVLRVNIYGADSPSGKSLFEWGYHSLKSGTPISGFSNVWFNPLSVLQLAQVIQGILAAESLPFGVYHLGTLETLSKLDFLQKIAKVYGFDAGLISEAVFSNVPDGIQRPENTTLDITKISAYLNMKTYTVESGIQALTRFL